MSPSGLLIPYTVISRCGDGKSCLWKFVRIAKLFPYEEQERVPPIYKVAFKSTGRTKRGLQKERRNFPIQINFLLN